MSPATVNVLWYAVFDAVVFVTGTAIASTNAGERMVWTGMAVTETYRAGKSLADAVKAAVADPTRRRAALAFLTQDPDPAIQERACRL